MKSKLTTLAVLSAMALPAIAYAQASPSSTVNITAEVDKLCVFDASSAAIDFGMLSNSTGLLNTGLSQDVSIANVWCNTGSTLTIEATALTHEKVGTFGYALPAAFARYVGFTTTVEGWSAPLTATHSASPIAAPASPVTTTSAFATPSTGLVVRVANLVPLAGENGTGGGNASLALEAGQYAGSVKLTLTAQ